MQEFFNQTELSNPFLVRVVPQGSIVLNGRNVFSPADSEVWFARGDSEIAQRSDPYTRRAFRDPHPLDDEPSQLFDNGNGYRILVGGFGVKATTDDPGTLLTPARTFDTLTSAASGGVASSSTSASTRCKPPSSSISPTASIPR